MLEVPGSRESFGDVTTGSCDSVGGGVVPPSTLEELGCVVFCSSLIASSGLLSDSLLDSAGEVEGVWLFTGEVEGVWLFTGEVERVWLFTGEVDGDGSG